ncbi:MAG TPA: PAS-domain containing protein [Rhizomicrobium sp.]|nr:PAS-domain containing protein [Rhizomicrobium sp.]
MSVPANLLASLLGGGVVALTGWSWWLSRRLAQVKLRQRMEKARNEAGIAFRDALLENGSQGLVVMESADEERRYFGDSKRLFGLILESAEAAQVEHGIETLRAHGAGFSAVTATPAGTVAVCGMTVGARAVLYLNQQDGGGDGRVCRDMLEQIPLPVWLRSEQKNLCWANRAFLDVMGEPGLEEAAAANAAFEPEEFDLIRAAHDSGRLVEAKCTRLIAGEPRTFSLAMAALRDKSVAGVALETTAAENAATMLRLELDAQLDMIERLPLPMAVLQDQKLVQYNRAFAALWELPTGWLDAGRSLGEILDYLREKRRLPEQRNFAEWKQAQLQYCAGGGKARTEFWHMPGGRSVRMTMEPRLDGAVFLICEDISEKLRLESSLNLLTQVQQATLDTLEDGIAIFGTDGRLVMNNAPFASLWKLSAEDLVGRPHYAELADICAGHIGRDDIWSMVAHALNSAAPEKFSELGKARRADGRMLSIAMARLPNGSTVVTFSDLTNLEKFLAAQKEDAGITAWKPAASATDPG